MKIYICMCIHMMNIHTYLYVYTYVYSIQFPRRAPCASPRHPYFRSTDVAGRPSQSCDILNSLGPWLSKSSSSSAVRQQPVLRYRRASSDSDQA